MSFVGFQNARKTKMLRSIAIIAIAAFAATDSQSTCTPSTTLADYLPKPTPPQLYDFGPTLIECSKDDPENMIRARIHWIGEHIFSFEFHARGISTMCVKLKQPFEKFLSVDEARHLLTESGPSLPNLEQWRNAVLPPYPPSWKWSPRICLRIAADINFVEAPETECAEAKDYEERMERRRWISQGAMDAQLRELAAENARNMKVVCEK